MEMVLTEQAYVAVGLRIEKHAGHNDGIDYRMSSEFEDEGDTKSIPLSLCPWCGASLLPKPVVVATKYRGKR